MAAFEGWAVGPGREARPLLTLTALPSARFLVPSARTLTAVSAAFIATATILLATRLRSTPVSGVPRRLGCGWR